MPKSFKANQNTTCPHCLTNVRLLPPNASSQNGATIEIVALYAPKEICYIYTSRCPQCDQHILSLSIAPSGQSMSEEQLIWPRASNRPPLKPDVLSKYADDYNEAAQILVISPKASAALARRCLQAMLVEQVKVSSKTLDKQIEEAIPTLPSYIANQLHYVREVGNLAAHPTKSTSTGEIMDIEPGEAEATLDVLDYLFDHFFINPAEQQKRKNELNKRLAEAGRKPIA